MPTYTPIQSVELTANTTEVFFSNIPQTYQDLCLVMRPKSTSNANLLIQANGDTAGRYTLNSLRGDGSTTGCGSDFGTRWELTRSTIVSATEALTMTVDFINYSNTTTFKTIIGRSSQADTAVEQITGCYQSTNAISSLKIYNPTFVAGCTFDLYGISPVAADTAQAFGGTEIYYDSTYVYHVFKGSGTFTPYRNLTCDYLVVAGGGSGGQFGAGGAGGLRSTVTATGGGGSLESALSLTANTTYTVTVGAGGAYSNNPERGANGSNSVFSTITSTGGGDGGDYMPFGGSANGGNGGSGGGAGWNSGTSGSGGTGTANQGYGGGATATDTGSAGGGGAGAAGGAGTTNTGGNGGIGVQITAFATPTNTGANSGYYAGGGGGGGANTAGTGGSGGGGAGVIGSANATSGITNTGGGGGSRYGSPGLSGNGGSGIVIVRYAR